MPRFRLNVRDMSDIDDLDLTEEVSALQEREEREERGRGRDEKRVVNPVALQRRQDSRKFGKEIARYHRERNSPKP